MEKLSEEPQYELNLCKISAFIIPVETHGRASTVLLRREV